MLFLGTEKYPEAGDYKLFVKKHGGKNNASTSDIVTCYQFDVAPGAAVARLVRCVISSYLDYLEPTLDRFAQFFISPTFYPDSTDREINAVDSEVSFLKCFL